MNGNLDEVSRLAADIAEERFDRVNRMFLDQGAHAPGIIWDPGAEDLPVDVLARLLEYWIGIRGGREFPSPQDIDPFGFKFALGFVMLIDVIDDGADFRYRLYGSKIESRYGRDMTGRRTSEFGGHISTFFMAVYRAVLIRRLPVFTLHEPPPNIYVKAWRRLVLPLSDGDGRIVRFLVGNVPEDPPVGYNAPA